MVFTKQSYQYISRVLLVRLVFIVVCAIFLLPYLKMGDLSFLSQQTSLIALSITVIAIVISGLLQNFDLQSAHVRVLVNKEKEELEIIFRDSLRFPLAQILEITVFSTPPFELRKGVRKYGMNIVLANFAPASKQVVYISGVTTRGNAMQLYLQVPQAQRLVNYLETTLPGVLNLHPTKIHTSLRELPNYMLHKVYQVSKTSIIYTTIIATVMAITGIGLFTSGIIIESLSSILFGGLLFIFAVILAVLFISMRLQPCYFYQDRVVISQGTVKQTFQYIEIMQSQLSESTFDEKVYGHIALEVFSTRTGKKAKYTVSSLYGKEIAEAIAAYKMKDPFAASRALSAVSFEQIMISRTLTVALITIIFVIASSIVVISAVLF